jgi:hypothetical protein
MRKFEWLIILLPQKANILDIDCGVCTALSERKIISHAYVNLSLARK